MSRGLPTSEREMNARSATLAALIAAAGLVVGLAYGGPLGAQERHGGFDARERARLGAGQLVSRPRDAAL